MSDSKRSVDRRAWIQRLGKVGEFQAQADDVDQAVVRDGRRLPRELVSREAGLQLTSTPRELAESFRTFFAEGIIHLRMETYPGRPQRLTNLPGFWTSSTGPEPVSTKWSGTADFAVNCS